MKRRRRRTMIMFDDVTLTMYDDVTLIKHAHISENTF